MAYDKSGGALFRIEDRRSEKSPLYQGDITITRDDLRVLIEEAKLGKEVKMKLTVFKREGRKGPFLSIMAVTWPEHEKERAEYRSRQQGSSAPQERDPWEL